MQDNILDWQPKHQLNELADLLKLKQGLILLAGRWALARQRRFIMLQLII